MTTTRITTVALGLIICAATLSACSHAPSRSNPPPHRTTTSNEGTTAPPSTVTTTTVPQVVGTCQPSQLHILVAGSQGAAGTTELTFSLTNTATAPCTLHGYPGMLLLASDGQGLPTTVTRGGGLAFENVTVTDVTLGAGQTAYFNLGYNDVTQGDTSCSMSTQVEVTPPNDTAFAVVPVPQINACGNGSLNVSPVFAANDAAATTTTAPPFS